MLACQLKGTPGEGKAIQDEYRISNSKSGL
jgi:hypothetical protein